MSQGGAVLRGPGKPPWCALIPTCRKSDCGVVSFRIFTHFLLFDDWSTSHGEGVQAGHISCAEDLSGSYGLY